MIQPVMGSHDDIHQNTALVYKTVNYVFTVKLLFSKLIGCFTLGKIAVYSPLANFK